MLLNELIGQFEQEAQQEQAEAIRRNDVTQELIDTMLRGARNFLHRYFATKENLVVPDELLQVELDSSFEHFDEYYNYHRVYMAYSGRMGYAAICTDIKFVGGEWKLSENWTANTNNRLSYFRSAVDALRHAFKEYGPTISPEEVDKLVYEAIVAFGRPIDGGNISASVGLAPYLVHLALDRLVANRVVVVQDDESEWVNYYIPANPTSEYLLAEFPHALKAHQVWASTPAVV